MTQPTTTRRDMLRLGTSAAATAIVSGDIVLATEARAAEPSTSANTPFRAAEAHYRAASAAFVALPAHIETTDPTAFRRSRRRFLDALHKVERAPIADWHEFADALEIVSGDGGLPSEGIMDKLIADARRLAGEA